MKPFFSFQARAKSLAIICLFALMSIPGWQPEALAQGSLTPSGPPGPMMKTLAQIEPRTPISSVPITLSNSGSYYFTSNLTVASDVTAITITTNNITLDLSGFTLRGFGGSSNAIVFQNCSNVIIRNGIISGWSHGNGMNIQGNTPGLLIEHVNASGDNTGLYLNCGGFTVQDCICTGNGSDGIYSDNNGGPCGTIIGCMLAGNAANGLQCTAGTIKDCQIVSNNGGGMYVTSCQVSGCLVQYCGANSNALAISSSSCDIRNCVVQNCPGSGIYDYYSRISDCSVEYCGNYGIYGYGAQINDCHVVSAGYHGIDAVAGTLVHNCHVNYAAGYGIYAEEATITGCDISYSTLSGIYADAPGNLISGNHLFLNNQSHNASYNAGIYVEESNNRIEDNHVVGSGIAGIVVNNAYYTGNVVVKNYVEGNGASNYVGTANNDFGPIGSAATTTSPWANISH